MSRIGRLLLRLADLAHGRCTMYGKLSWPTDHGQIVSIILSDLSMLHCVAVGALADYDGPRKRLKTFRLVVRKIDTLSALVSSSHPPVELIDTWRLARQGNPVEIEGHIEPSAHEMVVSLTTDTARSLASAITGQYQWCAGRSLLSDADKITGKHLVVVADAFSSGMYFKLQTLTKLSALVAIESSAARNGIDPDKPHWDKNQRQLLFAGKVARNVSPKATNVIKILNAFQENGWPNRIDDPLPRGTETRKLSEAVQSANNGLRGLKFAADGTGKGLTWLKR